MQSMKYGLGILIGLILVVALLEVAHINPTEIFQGNRTQNLTSLSTVSPTSSQDNWLTYTNTTFGYSLQYPQNWIIDTTKAESKLDKAQPFCYYANELKLTPPDHAGTLDISFGPSCTGEQPFSLASLKPILVQNTKATEAYASICDIDTQNPNCSKFFYAILYTADGCQMLPKNTTACKDLMINNQTLLITFIPKITDLSKKYGSVELGDPHFLQLDNTLDKIVESLKVPATPLHPEIEHLAK